MVTGNFFHDVCLNVQNIPKIGRSLIFYKKMGQRQKRPYCICIPNIIRKNEQILPLTINVETLTKWLNRKWISHIPEIKSQSMGPCANAVCKISRGCDK
jgi:hypothetical protein